MDTAQSRISESLLMGAAHFNLFEVDIPENDLFNMWKRFPIRFRVLVKALSTSCIKRRFNRRS